MQSQQAKPQIPTPPPSQPPGPPQNQNQWQTTPPPTTMAGNTGPQPPRQYYAQGGPNMLPPAPGVPPSQYSYPPPPGPPYYSPSMPAFLSPVYQSTLYLLGPVKRLTFCRVGDMTVAVDDTGRRLFNMMSNSYVHHTTTHSSGTGSHTHISTTNHYNYKLNIIDFQGSTVVSVEFPDDGGRVPISCGDRIIGTAWVPSFHGCGDPQVQEITISPAIPGSRNSFGFQRVPSSFTNIQVYRRIPRQAGSRPPLRPPPRNAVRRNDPAVSVPLAALDLVATLDSVQGEFSITFVSPELDVDGKILILALAQHVKRVRSGRDSCCVIL